MIRFPLLSVALAGALLAPGLYASPIGGVGACQDAALSTYLGANFQCSVGVLIFSNFSLNNNDGPTNGHLNATQIELNPVVAENELGGSFTISALGQENSFAVSQGEENYFLTYHFFIDPGPALSGAGLSLDPGNVTITDFFCNDLTLVGVGPSPTCINSRITTVPSAAGDPQSLSVDLAHPNNSITFNPPAFFAGDVETWINVTGPATFDSTTTTFDVINTDAPEPASLILMFGGAAVLWYGRKRALSC